MSDFQPSPLSREQRLGFYRTMLAARALEDSARDLFLRGLVRGSAHLAQGQEAVAAGFAAAMRADDYSLCTYRGHHHVLGRGAPAQAILAEIMGRSAGLMRGKGGSMHLTSVAHGVLGSYAIVGAHLPIAIGAAWSAQYRRSGQVAVCFFGDGATNIGAFHEALNLAAVWHLPVVFVCENNLYMEYSAIKDHTAVARPAADRAGAYGLQPLVLDGNDVESVFQIARETIERARSGEGPSLVEALTYRQGGHSRSDPGTYRPAEEVKAWLARDPILLYRARLLREDVASEQDLEDEARGIQKQMAEAMKLAEESPAPDVAEAHVGVWANGSTAWRN